LYRQLFVGDDDLAVRIWNSVTMQCVQVIRTNCTVAVVKLSCTHLAIGSFNAVAGLWTRSSGEMLGRYVGHTSGVFTIDFNVSWDVVVTGSADKTAMLWSLTDRTPLRSIKMLFKPTSVHLIMPSDVAQEISSSFMLVANDTVQVETWIIRRVFTSSSDPCRLWPLRFCSQNVIMSGKELPPQASGVVVTLGSRSVGAYVIGNKKLTLSCPLPAEGSKERSNCLVLGENPASVAIKEYCIRFGNAGERSTRSRSVSVSSELNSKLCTSSRYLTSLGDDTKMMLLAAGTQFSLYLRPVRHSYEMLIVHHCSSSDSQCVGVWKLPANCRSEKFSNIHCVSKKNKTPNFCP